LAEAKSARLNDKIASLREQMRKLQALKVAVHAAPDKQISLTDPDARSMATSGKDTHRGGMIGRPARRFRHDALKPQRLHIQLIDVGVDHTRTGLSSAT
jgi:hypothetical protein